MTRKQIFYLLIGLLAASCSSSKKFSSTKNGIYANENLIAWCIVPFDSKNRGPVERAEMLIRLGITKLAYDWRVEHVPTFDEELNTLKKNNIALQGFWLGIGREPGKDQYFNTILDLFRRHNMKTQFWCLLADDKNLEGMTQQEKIEYSAKPIAFVATEAAKVGCSVGLYNHGGWFGEPENQLAIIDYLKMPNIGIVYNFHHAETQVERFAEFFPKILPHLYALNIAGLKKGPPAHVVPVGQGNAEAELMKIVKESGYKGPVGIINETTAPDAEDGLRLNMEGLKKILREMGDIRALGTYKI